MGAQNEKVAWFQHTIREQQGGLIRYSQKIVKDEANAKDVVQDGFIKLWDQHFPESKALVPPWLYRICRNLAIDHYRKHKKHTSIEGIESEFELLGSEEEKLMNKEIFDALKSLPKKNIEVMVLMFQEGLSYKEIAEVTGITTSYVGVIIHQSLKTLRQVLKEEFSHV